jgi:predicted nucleotidyltransferase
VIVFGSHARGEPDAQSDLDFLAVQPSLSCAFTSALFASR